MEERLVGTSRPDLPRIGLPFHREVGCARCPQQDPGGHVLFGWPADLRTHDRLDQIEHPSKERRSAADAFYDNADHNYIAVANSAQVPKFVSVTPPVALRSSKDYHNTVFAMEVAHFRQGVDPGVAVKVG